MEPAKIDAALRPGRSDDGIVGREGPGDGKLAETPSDGRQRLSRVVDRFPAVLDGRLRDARRSVIPTTGTSVMLTVAIGLG